MFQLFEQTIHSRLFMGTAQYPSLDILCRAIQTATPSVITVSLRRQSASETQSNPFWSTLQTLNCHILPNTAGCFSAREAVVTAHMARDIFATNWIKLEVLGDDYNLQPDPIALLDATETLIRDGFEVFPYCTDDFVICRRLSELGCRVLMPGASPIGSGLGLIDPYALRQLRERLPADRILVIDAGIGAPSHAAYAMELGFDAVLVNTAIATADDPVRMAGAFRDAVIAGQNAYEAGLMVPRQTASASTPIVGTPFWHEKEHIK